MADKAEHRRTVRVAVKAQMSARGWNTQELVDATGVNRSTITDFLSGARWPQSRTLGAIETALGWRHGWIAAVLEGADPFDDATVGGDTQDADYVAAPGERDQATERDDRVLRRLEEMQEDINAMSRRLARIESGTEPVGGADGET